MANFDKLTHVVTANDIKNHVTLTSAKDIKTICAPLGHLGIHHFNYLKTYKNRSQINLCNEPQWIEYFYNKKLYKQGKFEGKPKYYGDGYTLWQGLEDNIVFKEARQYFDITNGITLVQKVGDTCEFFFFSGSRNNPGITNFYLNNFDLLERFTAYFKEKANNIITEAEQNRIITRAPEIGTIDIFQNLKAIENQANNNSLLRELFLKQTRIKNYKVVFDANEIAISSGELDCIYCLLKGKTAQETATFLGISRRTVEDRLDKLRIKFDCANKRDLLIKLLTQYRGFFLKEVI